VSSFNKNDFDKPVFIEDIRLKQSVNYTKIRRTNYIFAKTCRKKDGDLFTWFDSTSGRRTNARYGIEIGSWWLYPEKPVL